MRFLIDLAQGNPWGLAFIILFIVLGIMAMVTDHMAVKR
jgi:hypothetical protein